MRTQVENSFSVGQPLAVVVGRSLEVPKEIPTGIRCRWRVCSLLVRPIIRCSFV